jgi:hypothetical protein
MTSATRPSLLALLELLDSLAQLGDETSLTVQKIKDAIEVHLLLPDDVYERIQAISERCARGIERLAVLSDRLDAIEQKADLRRGVGHEPTVSPSSAPHPPGG